MAKSGYWHQARFWAGEYRRRFPIAMARQLSSVQHTALVRALEARSRPDELRLDSSLDRIAAIELARYELAGSVAVRIPPAEPLLFEDVFYYPPVRVRHLTNVILDVASGLVFSRGWVINESGAGFRWAMDSAFITGASVRVHDEGHRREGRTVAPVGNVTAFYHFLMETLPQMLRTRQAVPDVVFLTEEELGAPARELLALLDISVERVPQGTVLECSSLVMSEAIPRDRTHPADMQMLAEVLGGLTADRYPTPQSVYVSRAQSSRRLRDEESLEAWLQERGFVIARLEQMSYPDQVRLLASAGTVVAPHGAGLSNTVVMPAGGRTIELTTSEWWSPVFRRIAHNCGHHYSLLQLGSTADAEFGSADEAIALLEPLLD